MLVYQDVQQEVHGPLQTRSYTIFQLPSFDFTPNTPTELDYGTIEIRASLSLVNVFNYNEPYLIDAELMKFDVGMWYGLTDRLSIGIFIPTCFVGNGILDGVIDGFHDLINIDSNRELFDNYELHAYDLHAADNSLGLSRGMFIGNIMLNISYTLFEDRQSSPGVIIGYKLQLPTMSMPWYDQDNVASGVDFILFHHFGDLFVYCGINATRFGDETILKQRLNRQQTSTILAIDYKISDETSVVVQVARSSSAVDFYDYSRSSTDMAAGVRTRLSNNSFLELGIMENILTSNNSGDFGVYTGLVLKR